MKLINSNIHTQAKHDSVSAECMYLSLKIQIWDSWWYDEYSEERIHQWSWKERSSAFGGFEEVFEKYFVGHEEIIKIINGILIKPKIRNNLTHACFFGRLVFYENKISE